MADSFWLTIVSTRLNFTMMAELALSARCIGLFEMIVKLHEQLVRHRMSQITTLREYVYIETI
jgi:hypothetical protein